MVTVNKLVPTAVAEMALITFVLFNMLEKSYVNDNDRSFTQFTEVIKL